MHCESYVNMLYDVCMTTNDEIIGRNVHMARTNLRKMSLLRLSLRCFDQGLNLSQRDLLKVEAGTLPLDLESLTPMARALMVSVDYLTTDRPAEWANARERMLATPRSVPDAAERAIDGLDY